MHVIDTSLRSFVEGSENTEFSIQNLPYGVFRYQSSRHIGVAITNLEADGYFDEILESKVFDTGSLNAFMATGREIWTKLRVLLAKLLAKGSDLADTSQPKYLVKQSDVEMVLPVDVAEFTDFYSAYYHAFNVGSIIRGPENALMPNWKHLPVAYHGRSSSVILSGESIHRPRGQIKPADSDDPVFSATKRLDFELEMGFFIGTGNKMGHPISTGEADSHIFGMVLVNDWSARDVQVWEYRPLGPFLAKNFATSISPWVVTLDALEPFRTKGMDQDPEPLPYLQFDRHQAYDIELEVHLQSESMDMPQQITWSNAKNLYWNISQQLAHHTITGCNTRTGDLMGSGTISGQEMNTRGCLLELTELGRNPISIGEETRTFLHDGDTVIMRGYAQKDGIKIGFGEVRTKILPVIS
ncbi:MAG: fumarylacetoacetase [Candidatus Kariarchaeaceae archaeon]|jgi:fumarylacetoacetase